jgi:hypothetical protein
MRLSMSPLSSSAGRFRTPAFTVDRPRSSRLGVGRSFNLSLVPSTFRQPTAEYAELLVHKDLSFEIQDHRGGRARGMPQTGVYSLI